jgi:hypothetical protein
MPALIDKQKTPNAFNSTLRMSSTRISGSNLYGTQKTRLHGFETNGS